MALLRPVAAVAFVLQRNDRLVRRWVAEHGLTSACDVRSRQLLVCFRQASELSAARQKRGREPVEDGAGLPFALID